MNTSHIPISPREHPPLGYYTFFTASEAVAAATQSTYLPELDTSNHANIIDHPMLDDIAWLNAKGIEHHTDTSSSNTEILNKLSSIGVVKSSKVPITSCYFANDQCGLTEYQEVADNHMGYVANKHRLSDGESCKLCGSNLETRQENSLLLNISSARSDLHTVDTPYLRKSVEELQRKFTGSRVLLSRLRETRQSWGGFNIDNDFNNYTSHARATQHSKESLLYLASPNTALPLMAMLAISQGLNLEASSRIISVPKLTITSSDEVGESFKARPLEHLRAQGISHNAISFVLLQTLGASSHELSLLSREFGAVERRILSDRGQSAIEANGDALDTDNASLDTPIRFNRQLFNKIATELSTPTSDLSTSRKHPLEAKIIRHTLLNS